jgi:hypothetical protein
MKKKAHASLLNENTILEHLPRPAKRELLNNPNSFGNETTSRTSSRIRKDKGTN